MNTTNQTNLIPASDIVCYWNVTDTGKICDFTVLKDENVDHNRWQFCRGKCDAGWVNSQVAPTEQGDFMNTPDLLFGEFIFTREFKNNQELRRTIQELAKIQECIWARKISTFWPVQNKKKFSTLKKNDYVFKSQSNNSIEIGY